MVSDGDLDNYAPKSYRLADLLLRQMKGGGIEIQKEKVDRIETMWIW